MFGNTLMDTANKVAKVLKWIIYDLATQAGLMNWSKTLKSQSFEDFSMNKYLTIISVHIIVFNAREHFFIHKIMR